MTLIILTLSLAVLIALLACQALAIWRGRARYGSLLASQQALAARNAADFNAVLLRLVTATGPTTHTGETAHGY